VEQEEKKEENVFKKKKVGTNKKMNNKYRELHEK
jgi:hypothetical protein